MIRKHKIILGVTIITAIVLTIIFVVISLDRLDFENYGLNYNYVTANFTSERVYVSGLHLIGLSNTLLEVPKTARHLSVNNVKTWTSDFFALEASAEISYILNVPKNQTLKFAFLQNFYILLGEEPEKILHPLMKNAMIKIISNYSSTDYQNSTSLSTTIETRIASEIQLQTSKWTDISVSVLLSQLVSKGVSQNYEALNRKIDGLVSKSQRVQSRKIEITSLMDSILMGAQLKAELIKAAIYNKITAVTPLLNSGGANGEIGQILLVDETTSRNLSYSSDLLQIRPELYLINNSSMF